MKFKDGDLAVVSYIGVFTTDQIEYIKTKMHGIPIGVVIGRGITPTHRRWTELDFGGEFPGHRLIMKEGWAHTMRFWDGLLLHAYTGPGCDL